MKLGKLPAQRDRRNIKLLSLLPGGGLPVPPPEYDVDFDNPAIWPLPLPMFANDQWGCCVIAGRAHFTLRMEKLEQGIDLGITDDDVLREYWKEQGDDGSAKPDEGLSVLASIKSWRTDGWIAAGRKYNIHAFAEVDRHKMAQVKAGIWLLNGLMVGVNLYQDDLDAIGQKRAWDLNYRGDLAGGHLMYVIGYTRHGITFMTWGQRQFATWGWFLDRADEVYAVVDSPNRFMTDSPLDLPVLERLLKEVSS